MRPKSLHTYENSTLLRKLYPQLQNILCMIVISFLKDASLLLKVLSCQHIHVTAVTTPDQHTFTCLSSCLTYFPKYWFCQRNILYFILFFFNVKYKYQREIRVFLNLIRGEI